MRLESAHMDKKLLLIRHLYGEADEETKLNELLDDPDLKEEYQALSEAKFWLDHTKSEKPSATAVDHVLAMALNPDNPEAVKKPVASTSDTGASETSASGTSAPETSTVGTDQNAARVDRPPVARQRFNKRFVGISAFAMVIVITTLIGYQWFAPNGSMVSPALENQVASDVDAAPEMKALTEGEALMSDIEERQEADVAAGLTSASASQTMRSASPSTVGGVAIDSTLPDWDRVDDIIRYKQRIDMLLEQNQDLAWDEPAVPLEMLQPDRLSNPQLQQARSRSNNN